MIVALLNLYLVLLFVLVKTKLVRWNWFWKASPFLWLCLLLVGLFIPMGWGAPSGPALVVRQSVQIVPNVAGEVIDVPVVANSPLKAGEVLFRIDPVPFRAKVDHVDAQLKFAELRFGQMQQLQRRNAGRLFDVQQREAEVAQLRSQLVNAKWDLESTTVRAPADGYATNIALRKGARVASLPLSPAMAFIDTSDTVVGAEIAQIYARFVKPGQEAEVTFKYFPGKVFSGRVESVLQAISSGQVQPSGLAVTPKEIDAGPFVVRVRLDDAEIARRLPAGSTGVAAIYTDHMRPTHVIRRVMLRQIAILNYVLPN
jgi:RND family efflux transporter MFP subunit